MMFPYLPFSLIRKWRCATVKRNNKWRPVDDPWKSTDVFFKQLFYLWIIISHIFRHALSLYSKVIGEVLKFAWSLRGAPASNCTLAFWFGLFFLCLLTFEKLFVGKKKWLIYVEQWNNSYLSESTVNLSWGSGLSFKRRGSVLLISPIGWKKKTQMKADRSN